MKRLHKGLVLRLFFNLQTLSVSVCSRSIADPVRFGNVFTDIYCRGNVKDERDATRTSRMGLGTKRTLMDELWMRYGLYEKSNSFSVTS